MWSREGRETLRDRRNRRRRQGRNGRCKRICCMGRRGMVHQGRRRRCRGQW